MTWSQRQCNATLPTVIYNPDVYRKWSKLFIFIFLWNYCLLIKSLLGTGPRGSLRQALFMTHLWADSELSREKVGIIPLQKTSNSSGVRLPRWKIALTVMMLFHLFLRLKHHFLPRHHCCHGCQHSPACPVLVTLVILVILVILVTLVILALSTGTHCTLGQKSPLKISTPYLLSRSSSLLFMLVQLTLKQNANKEIQGAGSSRWVSLLYTEFWASSYFFMKFSLASN